MIVTGYGNSGDDYDVFAWDANGNVWDIVSLSWVEWNDFAIENYRIPAVEIGATGRFVATIPDDSARYDMRFRGADLASSYLVWEDAATHGLTAGQQGQLDAVEDGVNDNNNILLNLVTFIGQVPSQVWNAANRTLTAFGFNVSLTPETEADIDSIVTNTDRIGSGTAIVFQPMTADGDETTIVRYDSYKTSLDRDMSWDFPAAEFGDWTGKEVNWKATGAQVDNVVGPIALTVSGEGTADQAATLELSSEDTDAEPGHYEWAVVVTDPLDDTFRLTARVGCMEIQDTPYPPATE